MDTHSDLKLMIYSEFFNIEMLIGYMIKKEKDTEVMEILVNRLRQYDKSLIQKYLLEIVYFTLYYKKQVLDIFLLDLCAENFDFFILITYMIEIWGHQFLVQSPAEKKRIRNMLEDCEISMVNGEKSLINYSIQKSGNQEDSKMQQKELYDFVIGKRSKNDFKDDVRSFMN